MADWIEVELIRDNSNQNSFGTHLRPDEKLTLTVAGREVATVHGDGRVTTTSGLQLYSPED